MKHLVIFPDEWTTGRPINHKFVRGDGVAIVFVLLSDHTTLLALTYPGGYRLARTSPAINWAIQESLGPDPRAKEADTVTRAWPNLVDGLRELRREWD